MSGGALPPIYCKDLTLRLASLFIHNQLRSPRFSAMQCGWIAALFPQLELKLGNAYKIPPPSSYISTDLISPCPWQSSDDWQMWWSLVKENLRLDQDMVNSYVILNFVFCNIKISTSAAEIQEISLMNFRFSHGFHVLSKKRSSGKLGQRWWTGTRCKHRLIGYIKEIGFIWAFHLVPILS